MTKTLRGLFGSQSWATQQFLLNSFLLIPSLAVLLILELFHDSLPLYVKITNSHRVLLHRHVQSMAIQWSTAVLGVGLLENQWTWFRRWRKQTRPAADFEQREPASTWLRRNCSYHWLLLALISYWSLSDMTRINERHWDFYHSASFNVDFLDDDWVLGWRCAVITLLVIVNLHLAWALAHQQRTCWFGKDTDTNSLSRGERRPNACGRPMMLMSCSALLLTGISWPFYRGVWQSFSPMFVLLDLIVWALCLFTLTVHLIRIIREYRRLRRFEKEELCTIYYDAMADGAQQSEHDLSMFRNEKRQTAPQTLRESLSDISSAVDDEEDDQSVLMDSAEESDFLLSGQVLHTLDETQKRHLSTCRWDSCSSFQARPRPRDRLLNVWRRFKQFLNSLYTIVCDHVFAFFVALVYVPLKALFMYHWVPGFWNADGYYRVSTVSFCFCILGFAWHLWNFFGRPLIRMMWIRVAHRQHPDPPASPSYTPLNPSTAGPHAIFVGVSTSIPAVHSHEYQRKASVASKRTYRAGTIP